METFMKKLKKLLEESNVELRPCSTAEHGGTELSIYACIEDTDWHKIDLNDE
jgi:hypothetical protein